MEEGGARWQGTDLEEVQEALDEVRVVVRVAARLRGVEAEGPPQPPRAAVHQLALHERGCLRTAAVVLTGSQGWTADSQRQVKPRRKKRS